MLQNTAYRLAEFKIIENKHGDLWWETHIGYKLGRYEITEMKNGQLVWKSPGGLGSLKKGCCQIRGNILFLEAGGTELSKLTNKEFMQKLNRLPDWKRTKYFCPSCTIYYCNTGAICRSLGEDRALNRTFTQKNFVDNYKANGVGITLRPKIVSKGDPRHNLKALFNLFKLSAIFILKLLCGGVRIAYMILRNRIGKWMRFRGY